ncbi:unnamed protein product [Prorocentrum cordatum]|uniref:Diacylglycerol kinase accessory domain-containing protein n=1 Tax=Prorocentrum cordatum TaxID=2364126 RepID=A0ABN9R2T0_9DINO|nr:unnamed protein product [Polarella glacialis]
MSPCSSSTSPTHAPGGLETRPAAPAAGGRAARFGLALRQRSRWRRGAAGLRRRQGARGPGAQPPCLRGPRAVRRACRCRGRRRHRDLAARGAAGGGAGNPVRVPVGVIPLGTGNDLSRQLGTLAGAPRCSGAGSAEAPEITPPSGRLVGPDMGAFMEVMAKFALAPATEFDLWEAVVDVHEAGRLEEVKRKEGEAEARLEPMGHNCRRRAEDGRCLQMRHSMINYASLGFESLIGLEFEKWRSERSDTSQLRNKLKYAELGLRYTMPGIMGSESRDFPGLRYQSLSSFMRSLQDGAPRSQARGGSSVLESSRGVSRESSQASEAAVSGEMQRARGQMQRSNSTGPACDPTGSEYSSMVFMNVECIMGGERKWPRDVPVQPSFDDQKLEALAFTSPVSMKLANGFGVPGFLASTCAVGQYGRPHATFLPGVTTAFQVDGEFYAASDIKSFELQFNQRVELLRLGKAQAYYKAPSIIWGA